MKNLKIILTVVLQIILIHFLLAQSLVNNGAKIVTQAATSLVIEGDFINRLGGNILNSGNINITGNWVNDATSGNLLQGNTGEVKFNGAGTQLIEGTSTTYFNDLNLQSLVEVNTNTSVQNQLILSSHTAYLNSADLQMEAGSSITGVGPLAYVSTIGTGRLIQRVGDWAQVFPVGTSSSFSPVELHNHIGGSDDFYYVNVFPDVLDAGTTGSTISEIDHCVNLSWNIEKMVPATTDLSLTAQWNTIDEGISFDRTRAGIGHYIPGPGWDPQMESGSAGSDPYSLTRTGITDLSAFAVGDINSPLASVLHLTADVAAFLEGPYNGSDMNTDLYDDDLIPLNQPFNTLPWNYSGTESVLSIPNGDVVGWILIELRDALTAVQAIPSTIMEQQAAFLLRDGSIVGLNGYSNLTFTNNLNDELFVVIWHRNHLGIMSANPVEGIGNVYTYNFTTGAGMAHGGTAGHKELGGGSGIYGMVGGDGDANSEVNMLDKINVWILQGGQEGYKYGDFNLDGQVNNPDKNDIWIDNLTKQSQVPE